MQRYEVEDDLAALVESLAKKRPFEQLTFNDALRRVLQEHQAISALHTDRDAPPVRQETIKESKKVPSPRPEDWVALVPDLKGRRGLNTWQAVCDLLKINTAGDSARRKLRNWVKTNRPTWPPVPDLGSDA